MKISDKSLKGNDKKVLRKLQQFQHYFKAVDDLSIRRIVNDCRRAASTASWKDLPLRVIRSRYATLQLLLLSLAVQIRVIVVDGEKLIKWMNNNQLLKKTDLSKINKVVCESYRDMSAFSNLKVFECTKFMSNEDIRKLTLECPLLEEVCISLKGHVNISVCLEYLSSLPNLKIVDLDDVNPYTLFEITTFLKKCKYKIEKFNYGRAMFPVINILASDDEVIPSIKYIAYSHLKYLPNLMRVCPSVQYLNLTLRNSKLNFKLEEFHDVNYGVLHVKIELSVLSVQINDPFKLLQFIRKAFPRVVSLSLVFLGFSLNPTVGADLASVPNQDASVFPLLTHLALANVNHYFLFAHLMFPGNSIKVLTLREQYLFTDARYKKFVANLNEVEELNLQTDGEDLGLVGRIAESLPSLRLFNIFCRNRVNLSRLGLNDWSSSQDRVRFVLWNELFLSKFG